ncbi:MAG: hypothetical protein ACTS6A_00360 [Candidatus Hodgkinia cicadicola]
MERFPPQFGCYLIFRTICSAMIFLHFLPFATFSKTSSTKVHLTNRTNYLPKITKLSSIDRRALTLKVNYGSNVPFINNFIKLSFRNFSQRKSVHSRGKQKPITHLRGISVCFEI